jgi:hypothetical protein
VHEIRTIQGNVAAKSEPSMSRFVPRDLQAGFFVTAPGPLVSRAVTGHTCLADLLDLACAEIVIWIRFPMHTIQEALKLAAPKFHCGLRRRRMRTR